MDTRNTYQVMFKSDDGRVWDVKIRADGMEESHDLVVFWYKNFPFKRIAHFIAKSSLISVIGDKYND